MPTLTNNFVAPDDVIQNPQVRYDLSQVWTGTTGNPVRRVVDSVGIVKASSTDPSTGNIDESLFLSAPMTDAEFIAAVEAAIPIVYGTP
ncbi:hypothetical protein ACFOEK_10760 [Litoribrevibacter euphylliae]|uniref:Uncharacterized protein n=1 Tax=Litoribrevibacter euphylliae TaxID=1834034 RepID=A0ABV7HII4_9GAMM